MTDTDNVVQVGVLDKKLITEQQYRQYEDDMFVKILTGLFSASVNSAETIKNASSIADNLLRNTTQRERIAFNTRARKCFTLLKREIRIRKKKQ